MQSGVIKYIIVIVIILVAVYLGQQPYFKQLGNSLLMKGTGVVQGYCAKGTSWVDDNVLPKIDGEVSKRGEIINSEVTQEKQKVSENILNKIGNYFSGIANNILHPLTPQTCQPVQPSSATQTKP